MVVVSTVAFHARVRGSVPGLGGSKETKMFLPHPRVKLSIVGILCDREIACSASDCQGSNFEYCVWRSVSSHSSHQPQEVLMAQFSLYVHKCGLKPDSFYFIYCAHELVWCLISVFFYKWDKMAPPEMWLINPLTLFVLCLCRFIWFSTRNYICAAWDDGGILLADSEPVLV